MKKGGEFTFEIGEAVVATEEVFAVNPAHLLDEAKTAFDEYIERLSTSKDDIVRLKKIIRSYFEYELNE